MDNLKLAEEKLVALEKALILETKAEVKFELKHQIADLKKTIITLSKSAKKTSQIQEDVNCIELEEWLLERMKKMPFSMLNEITFRYNVPEEHFSPNLSQATKAIEILKFGKEKEGEQFPKLRHLVEKALSRNFPD
jgi:hypothetical protein